MKQLLLNGCSFGECWQPTSNFLQKLGCDTVENISKSGTSFQRTYRTTIEWIAQHDSPHYVIIPITFSHRWELALNVHEDKLDGSWVPLQNSNFLAKEYNIQECDLDKLKLFVEDYYKIIPTIKTYWDKMFTEIVMLSGWLESNKINYLMFDMCNNFEYEHIRGLKAFEKIKFTKNNKNIIDLFDFCGNRFMFDSMQTTKNKDFNIHHAPEQYKTLENYITAYLGK